MKELILKIMFTIALLTGCAKADLITEDYFSNKCKETTRVAIVECYENQY